MHLFVTSFLFKIVLINDPFTTDLGLFSLSCFEKLKYLMSPSSFGGGGRVFFCYISKCSATFFFLLLTLPRLPINISCLFMNFRGSKLLCAKEKVLLSWFSQEQTFLLASLCNASQSFVFWILIFFSSCISHSPPLCPPLQCVISEDTL